jgi:hypothetical protein
MNDEAVAHELAHDVALTMLSTRPCLAGRSNPRENRATTNQPMERDTRPTCASARSGWSRHRKDYRSQWTALVSIAERADCQPKRLRP